MLESLKEYSDWFQFVITIGATIVGAYIFTRLYNRFILKNAAELRSDPTNYKFLKHAILALIWIVGFGWAIYTVESLRTVANSMLAGAGILAVAVGFASQHALSNIVSGIFIVIFKPFRVNDRLLIRKDLLGIVEDITLRHTVIRDFENKRIMIPNALISDEIIINYDIVDEKFCRGTEFSISYESDVALAKKIIKEEAVKHPLSIDNRNVEQKEKGAEKVEVRLMRFDNSSVSLRSWVWAATSGEAFLMEKDLYENVKTRFADEGIEIPYPHQVNIEKINSIPKTDD